MVFKHKGIITNRPGLRVITTPTESSGPQLATRLKIKGILVVVETSVCIVGAQLRPLPYLKLLDNMVLYF